MLGVFRSRVRTKSNEQGTTYRVTVSNTVTFTGAMLNSGNDNVGVQRGTRDSMYVRSQRADHHVRNAGGGQRVQDGDDGFVDGHPSNALRRSSRRASNIRGLERYRTAAAAWTQAWPRVSAQITGLPLADAHRIVVERAVGVLPFTVYGEDATYGSS